MDEQTETPGSEPAAKLIPKPIKLWRHQLRKITLPPGQRTLLIGVDPKNRSVVMAYVPEGSNLSGVNGSPSEAGDEA